MKISTLKAVTHILCEPTEIISKLPSTFKTLPHNYFYHPTVALWHQKSYKQSTFKLEDKKYDTNSGVLVRSKSELIIANILEEFGVLYQYQPEYVINGKKIYPDFVVRKTFTGETIIWEHFGALSKENYEAGMNQKMQAYFARGLLQFESIIYTFEFDLTRTRIEKLIKDLIISY